MNRTLIILFTLISLPLFSNNPIYQEISLADSFEKTEFLNLGENNTFEKVTALFGYLSGTVTDIQVTPSRQRNDPAYADTSSSFRKTDRKRKLSEENTVEPKHGSCDITLKVGGLRLYAYNAAISASELIPFKSESGHDGFTLHVVDDAVYTGSINLLKVELERFFTDRNTNTCPCFVTESHHIDLPLSGKFLELFKQKARDENTQNAYIFRFTYQASDRTFKLFIYDKSFKSHTEFMEEINVPLSKNTTEPIKFESSVFKTEFFRILLEDNFNPEEDIKQTLFYVDTIPH